MGAAPVTGELDLDPSDPYAREAQTFPRLSPEMTARIAAYGKEERLAKGTLVFARGATDAGRDALAAA
jgi:thioredoxin reductase (NADPH)